MPRYVSDRNHEFQQKAFQKISNNKKFFRSDSMVDLQSTLYSWLCFVSEYDGHMGFSSLLLGPQ